MVLHHLEAFKNGGKVNYTVIIVLIVYKTEL